MKTPVLVIGIALLAIAGGAAGYYGGELAEPGPTPYGVAAGPLAGTKVAPSTPSTPSTPLSRKTPKPSKVPPLLPGDLEFKTRNFSVESTTGEQVRLSIRTPASWKLIDNPKAPTEVKFVGAQGERAIRVESGFPPDKSVMQSREEIVTGLAESQPYENDVQIKSPDVKVSQVEGDDGRLRTVSTLVYTYIPDEVVRYVIVRWVATGDDDKATVEMSIAGLPQDVKALNEILDQATRSVKFRD
ncbi:hypothetical protein [Kribbella sp. NPDC023855]|uniref:hypothetical protein n=1 Tax=Kribbella sp. NPDC023855 TaxID=3154698 RepID=UPI0033F4E23D